MNKIFSYLIFAFAPCFAFAQNDFVITTKGDTLHGELKLLIFESTIDKLQVKTTDKKTVYTAVQIISFKKNGETYRTIKHDNGYHFMKVIKNGFLSLLAFNSTTQATWDGQYLAKRDGSGIDVPNLGFKKILIKFLSECEDVVNQIEADQLRKRDLEKIIDTYNNCLQTQTQAVVNAPAPQPAPASVDNEKTLALKNLTAKIESEDFSSKKDALDLLHDIQAKVAKNENVPNYLIEGLKSYLANTPSLSSDLEKVIAALKKE
jgi:hypothetical protein